MVKHSWRAAAVIAGLVALVGLVGATLPGEMPDSLVVKINSLTGSGAGVNADKLRSTTPTSTGLSAIGASNAAALANAAGATAGVFPVASGGTGSSTASGARNNLGLVIGTDVLAPNGSGASLTSLSAANISAGTLGVARGGTGVATLSGIPLFSGTSAVTAAAAGTDFVAPPSLICQERLTLETAVPVSTTDQTSKTTLYITPYNGNSIALYTGSAWRIDTFSEITVALGTLTSGKNYDVFVYDSSGTVTADTLVAWTSDTARATALVLQDGVYVKSGATTRRYLGTFRTTSTTTTEDSGGITGTTNVGGKRFVWNQYNRVRRPLSVIDTTDSWSYTTNTIRQARGNAGNQVEYVTGDAATAVTARVTVGVNLISNSSNGAKAGIGVDSTSAFSGVRNLAFQGNALSLNIVSLGGEYVGCPGVGYHYLAWLEKGADGTCAFYGDNGGDSSQSGMVATIDN